MDLREPSLGVTQERADWAKSWLEEYAGSSPKPILMQTFIEGTGKLGFVASALESYKPLLGPLYAWGSAVPRGTYSNLPLYVLLAMRAFRQKLEGARMATCKNK